VQKQSLGNSEWVRKRTRQQQFEPIQDHGDLLILVMGRIFFANPLARVASRSSVNKD
jgi:hypothetical protein